MQRNKFFLLQIGMELPLLHGIIQLGHCNQVELCIQQLQLQVVLQMLRSILHQLQTHKSILTLQHLLKLEELKAVLNQIKVLVQLIKILNGLLAQFQNGRSYQTHIVQLKLKKSETTVLHVELV